MSGSSAIWRGISTDGNGKGLESLNFSIQFELIPDGITDATGHLHQTEFKMWSGVGENEKSLGQSNQLQDTKFGGLTAILTGTMQIHQPPSTLPGANTMTTNIKTIKRWLIEDKIHYSFPSGRFGLRLNDFPDMNITPQFYPTDIPTVNWGGIIQDCTFVRPSEQQNRVDFIITFRYSFGLMGTTPNYSWE